VALAAEKGKAAIEVADTGIGIKPEELELVFDRFYRSKDERVTRITGTGLGLTLAREIARLHGGDITLESQIDKGSTFTLLLPLVGEEG
jgi:two-component system sensor histidine kinase VicK